MKILLKNGSDPCVVDKTGNTILHQLLANRICDDTITFLQGTVFYLFILNDKE